MGWLLHPVHHNLTSCHLMREPQNLLSQLRGCTCIGGTTAEYNECRFLEPARHSEARLNVNVFLRFSSEDACSHNLLGDRIYSSFEAFKTSSQTRWAILLKLYARKRTENCISFLSRMPGIHVVHSERKFAMTNPIGRVSFVQVWIRVLTPHSLRNWSPLLSRQGQF